MCGVEKELSFFGMAGKYKQSRCKNCVVIAAKEWKLKNPSSNRFHQAKNKLKIDFSNFERINAMTSCQICGKDKKSLHIDHCHKSGVFRGALCLSCNHGLGRFLDDVVLLQKAIDYINSYKH
jgi:hypothetical protein